MKSKHMCFNSRQGNAIVEAAIVFPIMVLSIVTVIYILLSMYSQTVSSAKLHMALAEIAADKSGCRIYGESQQELIDAAFGNKVISDILSEIQINVEKESGIIRKKIIAEVKYKAYAKGVIDRAVIRNFEDEVYVIDEEEYIRCMDIGGKIIKKAVQ